MQQDNSYILWLASWYPNKQEPFEGDFIQRHAYVASMIAPVTLVHVLQYGEKSKINENKTEIKITGNLREISISFRFLKTGIKLIDKIIYNFRYYSVYKKFIKRYIKENGKPSIVHVHIPMKAGMIARWIKRKWNIPYFVSEHASSYQETASDFFLKRNRIYRDMVRRIFKNADRITNVSAKVGKRINQLLRLDKKVEVIPNVVNESLFFYKDERTESFTFIHVSSFNQQKNVYEMLSVFASLANKRKDWRLLLVGPADEALKNYVLSLGLKDKINFTGEVSYEKVATYMQGSSVLVLFSLHENLPCVIEEALCCGVPVVSSETGGIREAVNDSNGILVPLNNKEALLAALEKMMDNYSAYNRKKISENALTLYSRNVITEKFKSLYEGNTDYPSSSNSSS